MSKIFISYRRSDSIDETGRLYDHLLKYFDKSEIFKDLDNIPQGENYDEVIENSIKQSKIFLAVIGQTWLSCTDEKGMKRIEQKNDWIKNEIAMALKWNIIIIPVLIDNAVMPNADQLPVDIQALAKKQAAPLRSDPDFAWDIKRLLKGIRNSLNESWIWEARRNKKIKLLIYASVLIAITAFLTIYFFMRPNSSTHIVKKPETTVLENGMVNVPPIPTKNQIKDDLVGKKILGWNFDSEKEIRNINISKIDTLVDKLYYTIKLGLEESGTFHESQVQTVYKLDKDTWVFDSVMCEYITFDYEIPVDKFFPVTPYADANFVVPEINKYKLAWKVQPHAANTYLTPETPLESLPPSLTYWIESREKTSVILRFKYIAHN